MSKIFMRVPVQTASGIQEAAVDISQCVAIEVDVLKVMLKSHHTTIEDIMAQLRFMFPDRGM